MKTHKLDKAIKLHETHLSKPHSATPKSQEKMMSLMKGHKTDMAKKARKAGVK